MDSLRGYIGTGRCEASASRPGGARTTTGPAKAAPSSVARDQVTGLRKYRDQVGISERIITHSIAMIIRRVSPVHAEIGRRRSRRSVATGRGPQGLRLADSEQAQIGTSPEMSRRSIEVGRVKGGGVDGTRRSPGEPGGGPWFPGREDWIDRDVFGDRNRREQESSLPPNSPAGMAGVADCPGGSPLSRGEAVQGPESFPVAWPGRASRARPATRVAANRSGT